LTEEDQRILGFGSMMNFQPGYERRPAHKSFQSLIGGSYDMKLVVGELYERVKSRLKRLAGFKV
jgi:hypothetical protein